MEYVCYGVQLGVSNVDDLSQVLNSREEQQEKEAKKKEISDLTEPPEAKRRTSREDGEKRKNRGDSSGSRRYSKDREGEQDEEEVYTDSSAFLKGTQSANPHNDYCQNFVDTGERPQNYIRDVGLANRFEEYPKLRELIRLKDRLIQQTNSPPMYLKCDPDMFDLRDLGSKFDVILIEPPLEEYQRTVGASSNRYWSWDEIARIEIEQIAAPRSFIWIWCGSSDGLDAARSCLKKWGFRRCEDICWIKTNIQNPSHNKNLESRSIFQRTKEHCLMGIRGTVRRSTDGDFIHANVDIDLIIDEEKQYGSDEKPVEIFHLIEHFCLGRRRLHIFGRDTTIRPGWLTIGPGLTTSNFDPAIYASYFKDPNGTLTGCTEDVERLRPKSPPPKQKGQGQGGGQRGGRGGGQRGGPPQMGGPGMRGGMNSMGGQQMRGGGAGGWGGRGGQRGGFGGWGRGGHQR
ncbi:hypothetical protein NP493_498g02038 [Ridgeia piscesae]|uniref:N(6)-adenosine-methyltransferase non-catalytic subunit METTL14 n=1 Tax=Ridgeia piscesae TaxID=27915 RepID=A0AAD9NQS3_RIDPI|nr:hypothetical protein NP493_498g02038 [Ridgeia piscesae]